MKNLNRLKNEPWMADLKRKLGKWYREAQRPLHKQPVDDEVESTGGGTGAGGTAGIAWQGRGRRWW